MIEKYFDLFPRFYKWWGGKYDEDFIYREFAATSPMMLFWFGCVFLILCALGYQIGKGKDGWLEIKGSEDIFLASLFSTLIITVSMLLGMLLPTLILISPTAIPFIICLKAGKASKNKNKKKESILCLKKEREENAAYKEFLENQKIKEKLGKDYVDPDEEIFRNI